MYRLNLSDGYDNYSQRKSKIKHIQKGQYGTNKIDWTNTCNVHSMAMAFIYSGWVWPKSTMEREPDALAKFIIDESLKIDSYYATHFPVMWKNWFEGDPDAYSPLEVHAVLAYETNRFFGCTKAVIFNEQQQLREYFSDIYYKRTCKPTSMTLGKYGHIVCVAGFEATSQQEVVDYLLGKSSCPITKVIFDDPNGKCIDLSTGKYEPAGGNDNIMPITDFLKYSKPLEKQLVMCHTVAKPVAVC